MRRAVLPLFVLGCALLLAALFANTVPAAAYTDDQAKAGLTLFQKTCQPCHGENGKGGKAPQLNDRASLFEKYQTADALYEKIHKTMPRNNPGSLTEEQALDAAALIMSWNHVAADNAPLTEANAAQLKLAAPKPTGLPNTGDALLPVGLALAGLLSIAGAIVLRKRAA